MVKHDGVNLDTYHGWLTRGRVSHSGTKPDHYLVEPGRGRRVPLYSFEQTRPAIAHDLHAAGWVYEAQPDPVKWDESADEEDIEI
jgi:hypothetical protein